VTDVVILSVRADTRQASLAVVVARPPSFSILGAEAGVRFHQVPAVAFSLLFHLSVAAVAATAIAGGQQPLNRWQPLNRASQRNRWCQHAASLSRPQGDCFFVLDPVRKLRKPKCHVMTLDSLTVLSQNSTPGRG
jgi:hypothetical protein